MLLYEMAITPSAKRVNLFLAEKGLEIPRKEINVRAGENLKSPFCDLGITGKIPLLQLDDGTVIEESVAICRYLDQLYPDDLALFGRGPLEQAQVEMWQRIVEQRGLEMAAQAFRHLSGVYRDRENCVADWGTEAKLRLEQFLPKLDWRLSQTLHVAGEHFSIADITALALWSMLARLDLNDTPYPHLSAWAARLQQRPAVRAIMSS
ncbi:glutathione S-transferase family protein [Ferrimonas gelatinilytica]|uniref:glutathione transferase n=1 Tax=Ferrimonas gelatinilytica TaxID=1255257 RepID=A0ABP9RXH0_9GAMM